MSRHSIEPVIVALAVPAIAVLLGMGWYKITTRRNRPFKPTLWVVFRWGYIFLVLTAGFFAHLDVLIGLWASHSSLFGVVLLATAAALAGAIYLASLDWRRAARKERK